MPLPGPTHIPPIGEQTDPDKVRVAAIVGGQMASAPARGFGLTADELTALQDLTALPSFGAGVMITTVVTTSGTYTKPAGLRYLEVTCVGGGGGSNGVVTTPAGQCSASGGGGGGGTGFILYAASALAASETYTVGAGGGLGASGGNTTFKGMTASGGGGGGAALVNAATFLATGQAVGGTVTGSDFSVQGANAEASMRCAWGQIYAYRGGGGGSFYTPGMAGGTPGGSAMAAFAGRFPGGGASGAANGASQAASAGAIGGAGCIIFKEFF